MYNDSYLVNSSDIQIQGELVPATSEGNIASALIDGDEYFRDILSEINKLIQENSLGINGGYFYLHNWWLQSESIPTPVEINANNPNLVWDIGSSEGDNDYLPFYFDHANTILLKDKLKELAENGVDVRIMVWINPLMLSNDKLASAKFRENLSSIYSISKLRSFSELLQNKVCLNTLGHNRGAMHMKFVICGNNNHSTSFLGGMDFAPWRLDNRKDHEIGWHDVGVKINGSINQEIFNYYRSIWNELINRPPVTLRLNGLYVPSHIIDRTSRGNETLFDAAKSSISNQIMPLISQRNISYITSGSNKIQLLRTLPKIGFGLNVGSSISQNLNAFSPISFAPDGIFEFRVAVRKAISEAQKYIYIEDQAFWSWEAFQWINIQIKSKDDLEVILFYGSDPTDPPSSLMEQAIINCLMKDLTDEQIDRITILTRPIVIHSKVIIVDDRWASIGSANFIQRSMYTDGELSVSIVSDIPDDQSQYSFAGSLRVNLALEQCNKDFNEFDLNEPLYNIDTWITVMKKTHPTIRLRSDVTHLVIDPLLVKPLTSKDNFIVDADPYHENFLSLIEIFGALSDSDSLISASRCI